MNSAIPPADITKRDIKSYFEQLRGMANYSDSLRFTQVNDLRSTITDKDLRPVLSLNLQKDSYTVQADYQEDSVYAYEKTLPLHMLRVSAQLINRASIENIARLSDLSLLIITPDASNPLPEWLEQLSPKITLMT